jgi:hypothetical protein
MVKAKKKIRPLVIKEETSLSTAMSNPFLRYGIAGLSACIITLCLFIFMIFITGRFNKYSDNTSETIFTLQSIVLSDPDARPERVQRPTELVDLMNDTEDAVDAEQLFENDTIPVGQWEQMFPGQAVIEDNQTE